MADPLYYCLAALMPFDGANNAVVFPDASLYGLSVQPFGNAKLSTTQAKFGATSAYFDGSGDYLYVPANNAFLLGSDDFTIELWLYLTAYGSSGHTSLVDLRPYGLGAAALYYLTQTTGKLICYDGLTHGGTGTSVPLNTWCHIAFSRQSGILRAFLDGVLQWTSGATNSLGSIAPPLFIGGDYLGGNTVSGYIDDLRITKRVGRYLTNFTPPGALDVGTLPLTYTFVGQAARLQLTLNPVTPKLLNTVLLGKDTYFGGQGQISGTTKIDAAVDVPVRRRVRLHREKDGVMVRETWSDAVTGAYVFSNIDPTTAYTVITYDHLHDYRAVVADNIVPDLIP